MTNDNQADVEKRKTDRKLDKALEDSFPGIRPGFNQPTSA
jgi:hypothetical protein